MQAWQIAEPQSGSKWMLLASFDPFLVASSIRSLLLAVLQCRILVRS